MTVPKVYFIIFAVITFIIAAILAFIDKTITGAQLTGVICIGLALFSGAFLPIP